MVEWILQIFNVKIFYLSRENKPKKLSCPCTTVQYIYMHVRVSTTTRHSQNVRIV